MKKYAFIILLGFILLTSLAFKFPPENSFPLFGHLIVLDPGHGSKDPGSVYKDEYEKDYNLKFAKSLKSVLESMGATVVLTRDGDYDLSDPDAPLRKRSDFDNRIKLIEETKPDIYLSLHMNSINQTKYYGSQVFYSEINPKNKSLAETIQNHLNTYFNYEKTTSKIGKDKYMFGKIDTTGVLIEYGFMSSPKDRENLKTEKYRLELAKVIGESLVDYFT